MTEPALPALPALPAEIDAEAPQRRHAMRRTMIIVAVVGVLLAIGAGRTVYSRIANAKELQATSNEQSRNYVKVTMAKRAKAGQMLSLPGTLQGQVQAPIGARASGYLKRWTKDIGASVAKGELLAELETPEIDQQLSQAIAARDQAASSLALARSTQERWEGLRQKDVVSQQDLEEKRSAVAQQQANVAAAEANVQRLRQLEGFKRVTAPFAGVITRRNVDVGDLIDAGGAVARPLFMLSQTEALRIYVNVPQAYAQLVKAGQKVEITQAELHGRKFSGEVVRTAASIDTATRTMQVEVALANKEGALLPGAYVQVALPLQASSALTAPTNTLLFRGEGTMVAVVDAQGKVTLRKVVVGRNYGESFELIDGLADNERIVMNPADWLADGVVVVVAPPPAAPAASDAAREGPGKERV